MKKIKKMLAVVMATVFILFGVVSPNPVFAEDIAYNLSTEDWRIDLGTLNPGDVIHSNFTIKNIGSESFTYKVNLKPYTFNDDGVTVSYENTTNYTQMTNWVVVDNDAGTVEPYTDHTIYFTVTVPQNAPAGSQYIALHTTAYPSGYEDNNSTNIIRSFVAVAPILHADINGKTAITGNILDNAVPSFVLDPPISTSSMVENTGNMGFKVSYYLQVFPLFSDEEVYTTEENPATGVVMPESKYYISQKWEETPQIGIFKVRQTISMLEEECINEKTVIVCPIWLLFIIIFVIIAIIIWLVVKAKNRKKSTK